VCNFASSILITMLCIMTDLELQLFNSDSFLGGNTQHLQTHFILEEATYIPGGEGHGNILFTWLRWQMN
ncbi:MAG: hypothetical protein Q8J73_12805, partial [Methylotenera sp.]|nr:hypothetical protein [Methylotenera sp.]